MAVSQRAPTKREVDLAEIKRKGDVQIKLAYGVVGALWIAVSAVPIYALQWVVEPLAGTTTSVDANVGFTVAVTLSIIVNVAQQTKTRSQRTELRRQRKRLATLEQEARK